MTFDPTPEQQAIISWPREPLRVVAGAGTGKTTTIVQRLVAMVHRGMPPERAIGISFTNKAADELAAKLRTMLPELADSGREIEVTTYHGFASAILQEFGAVIGVERDADIIGPGYVRQLLQEAIAARPHSDLDLTWIPARVEEAADLASQLARNLRRAEVLLTPDPGTETERVRAEIAAVVAEFEKSKRRLGVLDYGDLIFLAHRVVTEHPSIASLIRDRYEAAVLDEYQDTDPAQRELLRTIFGAGFATTAVGDADQTIYEWRGASPENFHRFPEHFTRSDATPASSLPLTENRRSGALILDVAHRIRSAIHRDASFDRLRPVADTPPGVVRAGVFRTAVGEAEWVAEEVIRLHSEEAVAWREMAIILRKNRDIALLRDALQGLDVPVEVAALGGLLDLPDIADLHAWLRIVDRPDDSVALARILLGPSYRLGFADIVPLAAWARAHRRAAGSDEVSGWSLIEAIDHAEELEIGDETTRRLQRFRAHYRGFLAEAQATSLVDLARHILDATGTWSEIEAREPGAALTARINLFRFLDLAEQWSPLRGRPTLEAFLGYLDLLEDESAATELDTASVGTEDAVVLLTAHRAKGLEWDTVFVPALVAGVFPVTGGVLDNPRAHARFLPYELRLEDPVSDLSAGDDLLETLRATRDRQEWRTAYVAVTRARQRLYCTGSRWHGDVKNPRDPSPILQIALETPGVEIVARAPDPGPRPIALGIESTHGSPDPLFPEGWEAAMRAAIADPGWPAARAGAAAGAYDAAVDQLELIVANLPAPPATAAAAHRAIDVSVTSLVTLAGCPQRFRWTEVDPLPRRPSPSLQRGVEVHRRIELNGRGQIPLEDLSVDLYDAVESLGPVATTAMTAATTPPYDVYLGSRFAESRPLLIEAPIDLRITPGRVRGRIDAIYANGADTWEIVDFKSGSNRNDPTAMVQLEAYAVAVTEGAVAPNPPSSLRVTFAYLGGGKLEEVVTEVDAAWIAAARGHLEQLVKQAAGPEFPPRPSAACRHCDFLIFCEAGKARGARPE